MRACISFFLYGLLIGLGIWFIAQEYNAGTQLRTDNPHRWVDLEF